VRRELRAFLLVLALVALSGCGPGQERSQSDGSPASSVTLALLGDVMLGRDIHPAAESFAYLEPSLSSADLVLANLESPLTDSPVESKSPYALCASPENAGFLVEAGFDLLSIANNHNLDCGAQGLSDTQSTLSEAGLGFLGPGPEPVYRTAHGIRLAFLAFDATSDQFDTASAIQAVRSARETGGVVVVSVHWGAEYQSGASTGQQQLARQLADAGAALVWGHHPHVLQPSAWLGDERRTLVLYSLGNALFDQQGLASTRQSALLLVTLDAGGVKDFKAIPFLIDVRNSWVAAAGDEDRQRVLEYFR
jgi:poly-gamma-glutamate capsule biosynthesis protein CapA/YwtB (metallophosphatase superfamily)